jgi:ubiquinone/menaquinone biosynthesis C-methylase UbiE
MSVDEARVKSKALWDRMAPGWQKHNDYLWQVSRPVGEWLVDHLEPKPGQTILDIAAGPGNTGFVAANLIGPEGKLISTDFAEEMVDVARSQAEAKGVTNAEFKAMDAENMDLPDDSVDGIICRWGFMLMLDPATALKETRRVLKPGGKLAFSVWGGPMDNPWVTHVGMVLTNRGTPPQNDPFGPGGMFSMSEHDRIRELVSAAGYENVEIEDMEVHWVFEDFDQSWAFTTELAGAIAVLIEDMDEAELAEFKEEVRASSETYRSGKGYDFPGKTINVLAH